MKRLVSKAAALCLAALSLGTACTSAPAAPARMAEAAHKGTFNYLRVGPDHRARIIEKMPQGTRFEVVGAQGDYFAVILADGTRGWTAGANVRFL